MSVVCVPADAPHARYNLSALPSIGDPTVTRSNHIAPLASQAMWIFRRLLERNPPSSHVVRALFAVSDVPSCPRKTLSESFWENLLMNYTFFVQLQAWMAGKKVSLVPDELPEPVSLPSCLCIAQSWYGLRAVCSPDHEMGNFFLKQSQQLLGHSTVPQVCGRVVWFGNAVNAGSRPVLTQQ